MLHFPNLGWDGKRGLSTVQAGTQNIGLALAEEAHAAKFYGQGAQYNVVMKFPGKVGEETAKNITSAYLRKRQEYGNEHSIPLIIEQGGDISQVSMSARDAQALEARQYSAIDQCKWFGVPPVLVGESEKTSSWGSGVAEVIRGFVMSVVNDHFSDIEQELEFKLFPSGRFFADFDESELLRGDVKTQGEFYRIARGNSQEPGILTIEEIRLDLGYSEKPERGELQKPTVGSVPNEKPNPETV
jgi:HK97 family phage portal protein